MGQKNEFTAIILARWVLRIALAVALVYVLWRIKPIIFLVLLSAVLAASLEPLVVWICRHRLKFLHPKTQRLWASFLVFAAFITLVVATVSWLAAPFGAEFRRLADYAAFARTSFEGFSNDLEKIYNGLPSGIRNVLSRQDTFQFSERMTALTTTLLAQASNLVAHIWEIFLIPVFAFYFLVDSLSLKKGFVSFFPKKNRFEVMRILQECGRVFRTYIIGQIILCLIAGLVMGGFLFYWDIKYALTLAVLAGITRAVPIVGPIFSGAVIVLVILTVNVNLAVTAVFIFSILHFAESKLIMPMLLGDMMRLHPALLLFSILVGYEFFGLMGMFLAAPVAAVSRTLIIRYYLDKRNPDSGNPPAIPPKMDQSNLPESITFPTRSAAQG